MAEIEHADYPEFFGLVGNVRAMRRLKPDPVPLPLIHKVLNAGVQAPSGQNLQPWAFLLLSEPDGKQWFAEQYAKAMESRFGLPIDPRGREGMKIGRQLKALFYQIDHLHEAPYLLLVCGKLALDLLLQPSELYSLGAAAGH